MEKFTKRDKKNSLITILLVALVLVGGYLFTVFYNKYDFENSNLYVTREEAIKAMENREFNNGTEVVKKIEDETGEYYLILYEPEHKYVGVRAFRISKKTSRFLFFSKSGYYLGSTSSFSIGEGEGGSVVEFDNLLISVSIGDEKPSYERPIEDYFSRNNNSISEIKYIQYNDTIDNIIISKNGKEEKINILIDEIKFNGQKVKFVFTKLP